MTGDELRDVLIATILELTEEEAAVLLKWWKEVREHGQEPRTGADHQTAQP